MAINKKLIHFKSKENFKKEVANENILDTSICFILDSKEISTHGTVYKTVNWSILEEKERDYSKEYFTVKTNSYVVVLFSELITGEIFFKKLNLHPNNTNTLELEWYNAEYNQCWLWPGEEVIIKNNFIESSRSQEPKLYIYVSPEAPEFIEDFEIIIQGNIASLIYGDDFIGKTSWPNIESQRFIFDHFFQGSLITDASNLVLPFMDFASYNYMFGNCFFLKKAPKILPLKKEHERYGIGYAGMFLGCSSLEESPIICAQSFVNTFAECGNMFEGCTKLRKITMLATNFIYDHDPLNTTFYNWVNGVASEGVFIKNKDIDLSILLRGKDIIPEGWVIEDYKE